ncbi:MAG TPA: class I SAM-dependent methyltransferase [Pseudolabrys sp.]|nr:class I SAM-dependent methyltransferase [Pseudolabrys sp.]
MTPDLLRRVLYEQTSLPIFQNRMYPTEAEAKSCPKGDMCLVEDQCTGLIYNAVFNSDGMIYDAHYQNEQGVSPLFRVHLEAAVSIVLRDMGKQDLVEIGCGKGLFLEMLLAQGADVTGFDPAYEGSNPRVLLKYFEPSAGICAKGLVMRHVLEHVQNPYEFLVSLRDANKDAGLIYIEVPCFDWICEHRAWFDIFYEHVNYFRLSDFHRMFGRVVDSGRLFGGQYLYVVADLASLKRPQINSDDRAVIPNDFTRGIAELARSQTGKSAIWGGASKGVIFAMLRSRLGEKVEMVIDINPAKQGKYLPGTGLLVHSPERAMASLPPGSTIYVMNSNYLEEIKVMSKDAYNYIVIDRARL